MDCCWEAPGEKKVSGFICHRLLGFADECLLVKGMVAPECGAKVEKESCGVAKPGGGGGEWWRGDK